MAFDCMDKKRLLYADLFKSHKKDSLETEQKQSRYANFMMPESGSSSSLSSNQLSSFCDSSSSGFSTPFDSDLGSSGSEDGDFMAELTRQVAECMLQEDEEEIEETEFDEKEENPVVLSSSSDDSEGTSSPVKNYMKESFIDSDAINNLKNLGSYPNPIINENRTPLPLQVYQLKNQPVVSNISGFFSWDRTESTQQKPVLQKTKQQLYSQYRVSDWGTGHGGNGNGNGQFGSGMRAVFLGGSGSRNGSSSGGTGVFLPRVSTDSSELKRKSGCSTVLIPTRVLDALELHFNGNSNTTSHETPPLVGGCGSLNHSSPKKDESSRSSKGKQKGQSKSRTWPTEHEVELQLPQEWTY